MAKGNLPACLNITLKHEGKYTNNPKDPGNWTGGKVGVGVLKGTNMGVAAHSFPHLDIKNLKEADVIPIYRDKYWSKVSGEALPYGIDLAVFDYGVNSGPPRGVKALQAELGEKVDGKAGVDTINAAARSNVKKTIQGICARRMSFLRGLTTWNTFKGGWSRRVADIEAKAVVMWLSRGSGATSAETTAVLKEEAQKADKTASTQSKGAGGAAGGGGVAIGGDTAATGDINWLLVGGIAAAVIVVAVVLIVKSRHNKERAKAYLAAVV